ncbi:hypothetical protein H1R16_02545 [Marnyiella aurantia]|uniref:DUF4296 domain-containing protein n=1 Tax=Marnyiella aurantia TaxID=2758037 RepID=A0A7D7QL82_9FLAO|nr:hypothetical protein [Marnyiella aurantia]MBA5245687.1 hypothetical protein [Marnyiella aurantia]MBP0613432.1 hypothetical protein [Marnyiella aurantia]QMS98905.1 hypothetical protein H1R16_02545 [Marnyiella aurantia]
MKRITVLIGLATFVLVLTSCKENEVEQLRQENEELKSTKGLTRTDSVDIYNAIQHDSKRRFATGFLDSIKKRDIKLYEAFIEEAESRNTLLLGD